MSFKTIMFVVMGLVLSTAGTLLLMRGDMQRMQAEQHAHNVEVACREQAASDAAARQQASEPSSGMIDSATTQATTTPRISCPTTPVADTAGQAQLQAQGQPQAAEAQVQDQDLAQAQEQSQPQDQPATQDQSQMPYGDGTSGASTSLSPTRGI